MFYYHLDQKIASLGQAPLLRKTHIIKIMEDADFPLTIKSIV
jgi:hypothetical protein